MSRTVTLGASCERCGCALTIVFDFVGRQVRQECHVCRLEERANA